MTTSYSAEYKAAVAMSEETAIRTISRKLSMTGIICDAVIAVYTLLWLCFFCNFLRLNFYQPQMMRPWHPDRPFWALGVPVGLLILVPIYCYALVYYRLGILWGVFLFFAVATFVWGAVSFGYLIHDWISCADHLWCTCLTDYSITAGIVTTVACAEGNGPSGVFLAHFWLLFGLLVYVLGMIGLSTYFHFSYSHRVHAEDSYNPGRVLIADSINNSGFAKSSKFL